MTLCINAFVESANYKHYQKSTVFSIEGNKMKCVIIPFQITRTQPIEHIFNSGKTFPKKVVRRANLVNNWMEF